MASPASVSVVIPTIGRPSLGTAVRSAAGQVVPPLEIVVAFDGPDADVLRLPGRLDVPVRVVGTGGGRRANGARNLGIAVARGDLIALLDDDDEWHVEKLAIQLAEVTRLNLRTDGRWISATAIEVSGEIDGAVWGRTPIAENQTVADYLFAGRWRSASPALQPSTWLAPRAVFVESPFSETVGLHDDWDWLIRTQHARGLRVLASGDALTTYRLGATDSIVASSSWRDSLTWVRDPTLPISRRLRADFLLSQAHRAALRTAGRRESLRVIGESLTLGRPSAAAFVRAVLRTVASRHHGVRRAASHADSATDV